MVVLPLSLLPVFRCLRNLGQNEMILHVGNKVYNKVYSNCQEAPGSITHLPGDLRNTTVMGKTTV